MSDDLETQIALVLNEHAASDRDHQAHLIAAVVYAFRDAAVAAERERCISIVMQFDEEDAYYTSDLLDALAVPVSDTRTDPGAQQITLSGPGGPVTLDYMDRQKFMRTDPEETP